MRRGRAGQVGNLARLAVLAGIAMSIAIGACSLNPQPIPPGLNGPDNAVETPGTKHGADGSTNGGGSDAGAGLTEDAADKADSQVVPMGDGGGVDAATNPTDDGGIDGSTDAEADAGPDASDGAPE